MRNQVDENDNNIKKCCKIHQMLAEKTGESEKCWICILFISLSFTNELTARYLD